MSDLYKKLEALYKAAKRQGAVSWPDGNACDYWRMVDSRNNVLTIQNFGNSFLVQKGADLQAIRKESAACSGTVDSWLKTYKVFLPTPYVPYGFKSADQLYGALFVEVENRLRSLPSVPSVKVQVFTQQGFSLPSTLFKRSRCDFQQFWSLVSQGRIQDISKQCVDSKPPVRLVYSATAKTSALVVGGKVLNNIRNTTSVSYRKDEGIDFTEIVQKVVAHRR